MPTALRLLIVEDSPGDLKLMCYELEAAGFELQVCHVQTKSEFEAALVPGLDVILADYHLPQFGALQALRLLQDSGLEVPFIVVTGSVNEDVGIECMRQGATDYLIKDRLGRLGTAVRQAIEARKLRAAKREAEEAWRKSEDTFRAAFESAAVGMTVTAPDGRWLKVNPVFCRMVGSPAEELLATGFQSLTHAADLEADLDAINRMCMGEMRHYRREKRFLHREGHFVWAQLNSAAVRDDQGSVLYFVNQIQDITERKRAEEALRESEEGFRAAFEDAPVGMTMTDQGGRFFRVNRAFCEMLGYTEPELLGLSFPEITHPQDLRFEMTHTARLITGELRSFQREKRYRHKDGHVVWVLMNTTAMRDGRGEFRAHFSQVQDITERKRAEEALCASEAEMRAVFAAMPDIVFVFDSSGRHLKVMATNPDALYRPPAERIGKTLHEIMPAEKADPLVAVIRLTLEERRTVQHEYCLPVHGQQTWFVATVSPMGEDKVVWVARDVTENKRMEQERELQSIVVKSMAEGVCLVRDSDATIVYANPRFESIFGYGPGELQGKGANLLNYDDGTGSAARATEHVLGQLRSQGEARYEIQNVRKDGTPFWCRAHVSRMEHPDHGLVWVAVQADISEERRIQEELRRSEELYRMLMRHYPEGAVVFFDQDLRFTLADGAGLAAVGLSKEKMEGRTIGEVFPRKVCKGIEPGFRGAVQGQHRVFEVPYGPNVYRTHTLPVRSAAGEVLGGMAVVQDVTERKRAEEALRRNESLFKLVLDTLPVGIWIADGQGQIILGNPAAQKIWGGARHIGVENYGEYKGWWAESGRRIEPEDWALARAVRRGETSIDEVVDIECFDGTRKTILNSSVPLRDEDRTITGAIVVNQDVSDRRRADRALKEAHEKLTNGISELQRRNEQMILLGQMGELLQSCLEINEFYAVVSDFTSQLFPHSSGAVYLLAPSRNMLESVSSWGPESPSEQVFAPDQCWALRRGRSHGGKSNLSLSCGHIKRPASGRTLCIPMMAQGETLGVLHLQRNQETEGPAEAAVERWLEAKQTLATAVGEQVALALANLNLRETLRKQAIRDPLTGLFNRRYMEESLSRELRRAQRKQREVGLILLDVDHFKQFNDTHGHAAGDLVLQELGTFLQHFVRADDIACRYGGEEFVLILPECSLEHAVRRAEELCTEVGRLRVQTRGQMLGQITISAGVSAFPQHGGAGADLLKAADAGLYRAKAEGRNRVVMVPIPTEA